MLTINEIDLMLLQYWSLAHRLQKKKILERMKFFI